VGRTAWPTPASRQFGIATPSWTQVRQIHMAARRLYRLLTLAGQTKSLKHKLSICNCVRPKSGRLSAASRKGKQ
jgi:hypothetical protein